MDALRNSWAQFLELYGSMTASARLTLLLLCVMVVGSLGYLFVIAPASGGTYLLGGHAFSPTELSVVTADLERAGLTGYEVDGNRIRVPEADAPRYTAVLAENDTVPQDFYDSFEKVIRERTWLTSSRDMERQWDLASKQELRKTLLKIPHIEDAYVDWQRGERHGLRGSTEVTATVSIKPAFGQSLDPKTVRGIRRYVAGAVLGLQPDAITLFDMNTGEAYAGTGSSGPMDNEALELIKSFEEHYAEKVRNAVQFIPGAVVTVNVEIDPTKSRQRTQTEYDPKKVALVSSEETTSSTEQSGGGSAGAEPGVASNLGSTTAVAATGGGQSNTESTEKRSEQFQASSLTVHEEERGGLPKLVTVAIGVPRSYYEDAWRRRGHATDATEAELQQLEQELNSRIQNQVAKVIPTGTNTTLDNISVETVLPVVSEPTVSGPSTMDTIFTLVSRWAGSVGLAVLALVSLLILRSMVGKAPPVAAVPSPVVEDVAGAPVAQPSMELEDDEFAVSEGPTLRDRLQRAVDKDPEMAANVLRRWIQTPKR